MSLTYEESQEIVNRPGKFEGEEPWVPIAYQEALEGLWEVTPDDDKFFVEVSDADVEKWHLDEGTVALVIQEVSDGFVVGEQLGHYEYEQLLEEIE